jgi:hypothetical protein
LLALSIGLISSLNRNEEAITQYFTLARMAFHPHLGTIVHRLLLAFKHFQEYIVAHSSHADRHIWTSTPVVLVGYRCDKCLLIGLKRPLGPAPPGSTNPENAESPTAWLGRLNRFRDLGPLHRLTSTCRNQKRYIRVGQQSFAEELDHWQRYCALEAPVWSESALAGQCFDERYMRACGGKAADFAHTAARKSRLQRFRVRRGVKNIEQRFLKDVTHPSGGRVCLRVGIRLAVGVDNVSPVPPRRIVDLVSYS